MRVLVTGAAGMLGSDVVSALLSEGHSCLGCDILPTYGVIGEHENSGAYGYSAFDLRDERRLADIFESFMPEAVVHCAAWRDAVSAEIPENRDSVFQVNAGATERIARLSAEYGSKLIYISTDYVFSGKGIRPWKTEGDALEPLNVYGLSKAAGESAVIKNCDKYFIIRTAWLFGRNGKNFIETMIRLCSSGREISVVDDQIGAPTYTRDLSLLISAMLRSEAYGIYHAANSGGYISRYGFALEICRLAGLKANISPVSTADFSADTLRRPLNGRLDMSKLAANGFSMLPDWKDAVSRYLRERVPNG
ncbi:MAG: dTDP-4-dehydrorhamnose reductase [Oscillospiraceae bacterium]|nr:dTDP-4-dehydrorhamnose reductase [Oscillospiraceae bacterium]